VGLSELEVNRLMMQLKRT